MTKEVLKMAAQAVLNQWNSPAWTWHKLGPTGDLMADLQEALAQPEQPADLQQRLADLHLYEEVAEHYAKCAISPEALRDWVAERVNTPTLPVQPSKIDVDYWVSSRQSIIDALEKAGFQLLSNANGFWLQPAPLPVQPQRQWAGLTGQEKAWIASVSLDVHDAVHRTDAKLKEKNT